jgi:hypothetical protein
LVWSDLVAEAKLFTADVLGKPLLKTDHEWAMAQQAIVQVLREYQPEIEFLRHIFSDRTEFKPMDLDLKIHNQLGLLPNNPNN